MADKDPQKLAAARRKLKEYQKKSREVSLSVQQQQQQQQLQNQVPLLKNTEVPANREDIRRNDGSTQNYVYDSGTPNNKAEKVSPDLLDSPFKRNDVDNKYNNVVNCISEINSSVMSKGLSNGNSDQNNEHYVNQLVTELKMQSLFTDNNVFNITSNTNNNGNNYSKNNGSVSDIKSAKDFFDSLPVSSQSSVDFSFDVQINSDVPSSSICNATAITEVPSLIGAATDFDLKNLRQDSQSDRSESIPVTPSEQDKSESSSSTGQSPKQISQVLELQLQELDTKLGDEINKNKLLTEQLQQSHSHISQLEESIEVLRKQSDAKIAALEEKLQLHVKTLEILVSEKTELQTTLTACQESISQKAGEIEELQSRLRASRHRVGDLERELGLAQALKLQHEKSTHEATCSRDVLKNEVDLMRKRLDESVEEVLDLKHKLEEKGVEIEGLKEELKEKDSQLSVSQLRIEQLSSSVDVADGQMNNQDVVTVLHNSNKELEQKIDQLHKNLKKVTSERDEASSQYQQYVTTLNSQLQTMAAKYENVCNQRDNLSAREASLVEHVATLEKQLQQSLPRKPSPPPPVAPSQPLNIELQVQQQLENLSMEKKQLEEQLATKLSETEQLKLTLEECSSRVMHLERTIERLEADHPDAGLLQAAIESDKVAASRAIAQNTDLKKQLEELQDAFIKLSNNKLELTEKLELEQNHCKELTKQLAQLTTVNKVDDNIEEKIGHKQTEIIEKIDFCSQTYHVKDPEFSDITIDLEAMAKLEDKFKRKMQEVAELSDEKQRLEHLVLQLQGETETIGKPTASLTVDHAVDALETVSNPAESITPTGTETKIKTAEINKEETAGKIRALLTEIGSSKLVTADGETTNFHPCPWCSGRLITV
ncbi:Golgi matrix protein 130 kD isoform X2 [Lycorma delicatula]|uniref:Golgi matrix protein 130 kD isoform X2 n=1 Tax=Lycorma delicatula TaxID=130591 RepID=UPI003F517DE1